MTTWIRLTTDTGIVVPLTARAAVLSAVFPYSAMADTSDLAWYTQLPLAGAANDDELPFAIDLEGTTTFHSFDGELGYREVQLLEACIAHATAGGIAILEEEVGAELDTRLYVCNGDGTATRHEARVVFPTYEGAASGMTGALQTWESARGSALLTPEAVAAGPTSTQTAAGLADLAARMAEPRPRRATAHEPAPTTRPGPSRGAH